MARPLHILFGSRGFTAIELTAVLAVTLLIAALGLSAYRTYTVRAQIAAGVALAADAQERVADTFKAIGEPPADRRAAGLLHTSTGSLVDSIEVADGRIEIRFGPAADAAIAGRTLSLTPFETAEQRIVWLCGNKIPGQGLQPLGFATSARRPVQVLTGIEARYLPPTCR